MYPAFVADMTITVDYRDEPGLRGDRSFEFAANRDSRGTPVNFVARANSYAATLTRSEVTLSPDRGGPPVRMNLTGEGASPSTRATARQSVADDARNSVRYLGVYAGIDVVYTADAGNLEYSFVIEPGADPSDITLSFDGVADLRINGAAQLVLDTVDGLDLVSTAPYTYQDVDGVRTTIDSSYVLRSDGTVGFTVGSYATALRRRPSRRGSSGR